MARKLRVKMATEFHLYVEATMERGTRNKRRFALELYSVVKVVW